MTLFSFLEDLLNDTNPDGFKPMLQTPDFDGDGLVNYRDISAVVGKLGSKSAYHPLFDSDTDGKITGKDIALTAVNYSEQSSQLDQQILEVFNASYQYYGENGLTTAIADGYKPFTPIFKGHGIHYYDPEDAVKTLAKGKDLEPTDFVGLNYSDTGDLLAVFYLALPENFYESFSVFAADAQDGGDFVGFGDIEWGEAPNIFADDDPLINYPSAEVWHQHTAVAISGLGSLNPEDLVFEQDLSPDQLLAKFVEGMARDDITLFGFETPNLGSADVALLSGFWMMHLWVHTFNPNGIFAGTNPLVAPDAPDEHGGHGGDHHMMA